MRSVLKACDLEDRFPILAVEKQLHRKQGCGHYGSLRGRAA